MSYAVSYCPICGRMMDTSGNNSCPHCEQSSPPFVAQPPGSNTSVFDLAWAFVVWGVSGGFLLVLDLVYRLSLYLSQGRPPDIQYTAPLVILSLALTMFMHVAGFVAAWLVVTRVGKRSFWKTLKWEWHPRFRWFHAFGLALLMFGVAILAERILPHKETELEKFLKLGFPVRLMVAALAVLTAPLIEEIVYRGVVYSSVEGLWGTRAAVFFVTALFALVHVPQYWGSYAAITAILSLSLVLTLLRAWAGKLLPCVATHFFYNGIQAVILLASSKKATGEEQNEAAFVTLLQFLGMG